MSKLGISKTQLLSDPKIKMLYAQYTRQQGKGVKKMKGAGLWDGFVDFLKSSKILSNVGGVLLPVATGALGGLLGTTLGGPAGTALGATTGAAAGKSGADYIKSLGFGKMRGGDSRLVINPQGTRLGQSGVKKLKGGCGCGGVVMRGGAMTYSTTGVYSHVPGTRPGTQYGKLKF